MDFTELGVCIHIGKVWFRIAKGQISSTFDRIICPPHDGGGVLSFHVFILLSVNRCRTRA